MCQCLWESRAGSQGGCIPRNELSPGLNPYLDPVKSSQLHPSFTLPFPVESHSPISCFWKPPRFIVSINASCRRPQRRHPYCLQMAPGDKRKVPPIRKACLVLLKARSWLNKVSRHRRWGVFSLLYQSVGEWSFWPRWEQTQCYCNHPKQGTTGLKSSTSHPSRCSRAQLC